MPALTDGERCIAFIEKYCCAPEGKLVGKPLALLPFQKEFILAVVDGDPQPRRAILSMARKNGKSSLIAALLLCWICGPMARKNSQIVSGAMSRDQAAIIHGLASKMIQLNSELSKVTRIVPSSKRIIGLARGVEYRALSAEGSTAHGLSPVLVLLDEAGQIKGPHSDFVEALETAQGAYDDALTIILSTQAATDADWLSIQIDAAAEDPRTVCHLYAAPDDCELLVEEAWKAANPALGEFRSKPELRDAAEQADRMPSKENSFRWLYLNQRIEASAPFVNSTVWRENGGAPGPIEGPVFAGLDLSEVSDLTAFVALSQVGERKWGVHPTFWLPGDGLADKARADRVPYDRWHKDGHLLTAPGPTVSYEYVATWLRGFCDAHDVRRIAFDRWNFRHLKPWLQSAGFADYEVEGDSAIFKEMGQGFASMSPALRDFESALLRHDLLHGAHPVLENCARNAVVEMDAAGNRKLTKKKSRGRIDGMVALAMALSVSVDDRGEELTSPWDDPDFKLKVG